MSSKDFSSVPRICPHLTQHSLVPRLLRSGTRTLKLCRRGEPGIFLTWEAVDTR